MSKILVTGAAGHVGTNLVRALVARGQTVRALVHKDTRALEELDVETVQGDVRDAKSLVKAFSGVELVFHTAAHLTIYEGEWEQLEAVNIQGTKNVVKACQGSGVRRLVHFSSIEALMDTPHDSPMDETRPLALGPEHLPYPRAKAMGETIVRQAIEQGLDGVIVYPTAIVGPNDYRLGLTNTGFLTLLQGKVPVLIEGGFDWVDVRDVASGALLAAEKAPKGGRYILGGQRASVLELARLGQEIAGSPAPRVVLPLWMMQAGLPFIALQSRLSGKRPLYTRASLKALSFNPQISHDKAARELGYKPRPLRQTVIETLQWFAERGLGVPPRVSV